MPTRIVTISHAWGAGGESIGRSVANHLGFRYVDEEIITRAAKKEGVDSGLVADVERRKGLLDRIIDNLRTGPALDADAGEDILVPEAPRHVTSEGLRGLIIDAIRETAELGNVVIIAHAASIPLADRDDLLRVFITASVETRVQRITDGAGGDEQSAAKVVKQSDTARAYYLQLFYGIDLELPTHYDLVVNTDALTFEEAADIVVAAVRRRG